MSGLSSSFESDESLDIQQLSDLNRKLRIQNQQYIEAIASLKLDYQQALGFVEKNEILQRENSTLQQNLHDLNAKYDDLQNRFTFLLQKQADEAKNTKINGKNNTTVSLMMQKQKELVDLIQTLKNDFEKEKKQKDDIAQQLSNELSEKRKSLNQLLTASKFHFGYDFSNFSAVINALTSAKQAVQEQPKEVIIQDQKILDQNSKLKEKNSKLKGIVFELDIRVKELENDLDLATVQIKTLTEKLQTNQTEFNHQLELNNIRAEKSNKLYEDQIQSLKAKIDRLTSQLSNLQNIKQEKQQPEPKEEKNDLQILQKLHDTQENLEKEKLKSNNLLLKLAELETKQKILNNKSKDKREQRESYTNLISIENEKLHREIESLKTEKESLLAEVRAAHTSYNQAKLASETSEANKNSILKANKKISDEVDQCKKEITELISQREKLIILLQKQNYLISKLNDQPKPEKTEEKTIIKLIKEEIPSTSYYCADFPRELCQQINLISSSKELNDSQKLRRVLQVISSYYNSLIANSAENISKLKKENDSTKSELANYLLALSEVLKRNITSPDDFITCMTEIFEELDNAKFNMEKYQEILEKIYQKIGSENVEYEIDQIFNSLQKTISCLERTRKKLDDKKQQNKELRAKLSLEEENNQKKIKEFNTKIEYFTNQLKTVNNKNYELQKDLERLKSCNSSSEQEKQLRLTEKDDEYEMKLKEIQDKNKEENEKLSDKISEKEEENKRLSDENSNLMNKLLNAENLVNSLKQTISNLNTEIDNIKTDYEVQISEIEIENKKQKEEIDQKNKKLLDEKSLKFRELSELHNKTMNALVESERRHSEEKKKRIEMETENEFIKKEIESLKDLQKSHDQILNAKEKAMKISYEMKAEETARKERNSCQEEIRKIINFAAKHLSDYFDICSPLNEETYNSIIINASNDISRLKKQDFRVRSLLGMNDDEKVEDFISKMLLSYNSN
ncbi:hypothetical protein TVAG_376190 [Trichomonas vaginalis G3]|uniref:Uncharacterized protein n=1 Tax=Trichomonas vaginalis (strain ATCC PRA-98 / G3) TaxID=412133 RepID=A2G619_TRIV3|nr:biological adhesion protein [Trichomonas vaginalis G3]EAX87401.1 hypothetical protein TVAG_376190 [Trichomonas vaginalis G3]KAI5514598.1 biological adhesion protein [Trichomonas vaginalis G3]|eukprot:XP_001300331.1 hypothetical protein [Trichomonas vaginalis G3]